MQAPWSMSGTLNVFLKRLSKRELQELENDARALRHWLWSHIVFFGGSGFLVQMGMFGTSSFMTLLTRQNPRNLTETGYRWADIRKCCVVNSRLWTSIEDSCVPGQRVYRFANHVVGLRLVLFGLLELL